MKERFLVIEIRPGGTDGLFFSVDEDRNILLEKLEEGAPLEKFLASPAQRLSQKSWEGKHLFDSRRRIIAAAGPSLATTIPVPLSLQRDRANIKTRITVAEVENLIAQAMAKVFNGCRAEAAKRMRIEELDAVLVGAVADHFKVDGVSYRNPAGREGKAITLLIEFTFAARPVFEALAPFFSSPEGLYFAEAPQAHLRALARVRKLPLSLISADAGAAEPDTASLYVYMQPTGEYGVLYREPFKWTPRAVTGAIAEAFAVSDDVAGELYCLFHRGELSPAAERAFRKIVEPATGAFAKELAKDKAQGTVYIDMPHSLPPIPPSLASASTAKRIEHHPIDELLSELGFTLSQGGAYGSIMRDERRREVIRPLLYFIEAYFDRSGSPINSKLRRRLHWLAA